MPGWNSAIEAAARLVDEQAENADSNARFAVLNGDRETLIDTFDLKAANLIRLADKIRSLKLQTWRRRLWVWFQEPFP